MSWPRAIHADSSISTALCLVIDEAQRAPKLFSYLQTLSDEALRPGRFILTGSQRFGLLSRISQSLAGRVGILQLLPFAVEELNAAALSAVAL